MTEGEYLALYPEGAKWVPGTMAPEPMVLVRSERDGAIDNVSDFLECMHGRNTPNPSIQAGFGAAQYPSIGNIAWRGDTKVVWAARRKRAGSSRVEVSRRAAIGAFGPGPMRRLCSERRAIQRDADRPQSARPGITGQNTKQDGARHSF